MDVQTKQWLQNLERDISELRTRTNRLPVQFAKAPVAIPGNVIYAQVVGAVTSGDPTGTFDNARPIVGAIPAGGTDSFLNRIPEDYADNEWVIFFQLKDTQDWIPERGGGVRYITIKGTTGAVSRSDPTFTLNEPVSVNGPVPSGTITVTNDPPINTPGGRTVYARYNVSVGSDDLTHWDTGDGGNWLLHDRGMADWVADERQVHDHDADGDPHWHGTNPCVPPEEE